MRSLLPASSKVYTMLSISERSSSKNVMPKKYKCVLKSLDDKYVPDLSVFFLWHRIYQLATLDVAPESILQARRARGTNSGLNDVMMSLDRWGILQDVQKNLLITSSNETFELCMEISSMQRQVYCTYFFWKSCNENCVVLQCCQPFLLLSFLFPSTYYHTIINPTLLPCPFCFFRGINAISQHHTPAAAAAVRSRKNITSGRKAIPQ